MGLLDGKVAIVTGGATGIGRAIVLEYLKQGAAVTVNHLDDEVSYQGLETLREDAALSPTSHALLTIPGDISKPETAQQLVEHTILRFNKLDILVSNAGVCNFADFLSVDQSLLESTISTNLSGTFYATQAAARQMVAQGHGGSIIGVSSISALVGGSEQTHYTPTKAGILSLMQSCACALGKHGIRCNALLPGTIKTGMNEADLAEPGKREYIEKRTPLGRTGVPGDLAGPTVFLGSDMSGYVTGAQLLVDGGLFVNLQ